MLSSKFIQKLEPSEVIIVEPPVGEPEPAALEPEVVTVVETAPLPVPVAKPKPTEPVKPEIEPKPVIAEADATPTEPKPSKNWRQNLNPRNWFGEDKEEADAQPKVSQAETPTDDAKDW